MALTHLPIDVFRQILTFIDDQPSLHSLSLSSLSFHAVTTPVLFSNARFIEPKRRVLLARLAAFLRTLCEAPYLGLCVKELVIKLYGDLFTKQLAVPLKPILSYLHRMDTFIFDCPLAKPNIVLPIFDINDTSSSTNGHHPMFLKKLVFGHVLYTLDVFIQFLYSQSRLEHLELPMLFTPIDLPSGLFPCLRILDTTLPSAVDILRGNRVTHLRVTMSPMCPEVLDVEGMTESLDDVMVLAVRNGTLEKMFEVARYMPNLEYLQLESLGFTYQYSDTAVLEWVSNLRCRNKTIRHIRFVGCLGIYNAKTSQSVIATLFDCLPSLRCLDFEAAADGVYDRWCRHQSTPSKIKWNCEPQVAWWRDWDDYNVLAVTLSRGSPSPRSTQEVDC
ncbi:hypothetical protein ONZ45_g1489 [Pleurotus djamor]|nr:hypothetical protein ONZ45_g1489 [Pleurotus djamor]